MAVAENTVNAAAPAAAAGINRIMRDISGSIHIRGTHTFVIQYRLALFATMSENSLDFPECLVLPVVAIAVCEPLTVTI